MDEKLLERFQRLSPRERDVFGQIGKGLSCNQLSKALGVSEKAAKAHLKRVMDRFEVTSLPDLVLLANDLSPSVRGDTREDGAQTVAHAVDPAAWVSVFDAHPDPLMFVGSDYRILKVNSAQAGMLGMPAAACEGRYCYELFHGTEAPPGDCPCEQVLREGKALTVTLEMNGAEGPLRVTVSPILDGSHRVSGVLHIARRIGAGADPAAGDRTFEEAALNGAAPAAGEGAAENRQLFDQLLAFVLHHLGQQTQDSKRRAALLSEFIDLLAEFRFDSLSLWKADSDHPQLVFRHTFDKARQPAPADPHKEDHHAWMLQRVKQAGFVKVSQDGLARCAVPLSATVAGTASYLLFVECDERAPSSACMQPKPMRFLGDVLGEIVRHAAFSDDASLGGNLTKREIAVIRLLEGDYPCKTIAGQLGVSVHTVHVHIRNIYRKLRVHTRAEAVQEWRANRWT